MTKLFERYSWRRWSFIESDTVEEQCSWRSDKRNTSNLSHQAVNHRTERQKSWRSQVSDVSSAESESSVIVNFNNRKNSKSIETLSFIATPPGLRTHLKLSSLTHRIALFAVISRMTFRDLSMYRRAPKCLNHGYYIGIAGIRSSLFTHRLLAIPILSLKKVSCSSFFVQLVFRSYCPTCVPVFFVQSMTHNADWP